MKLSMRLPAAALCALSLVACGGGDTRGGTRDTVRAVGSSTVYPFAKLVAEQFARSNPQFGSPIIEGTGSGGGIKLFCQGTGTNTPDIVNSSRRMQLGEFETCVANGVEEITELQIGLDGLAFASVIGGITMNLTPELMYRAIAAKPYGNEQTAVNWSDLDPSLPNIKILVYGPPSTSGTRDSLKELILEVGCDADPAMKELEAEDSNLHYQICTEVRNDGGFVDMGEQDNLIVQKIISEPNAVGVFGFSYLNENSDRLQGLTMNGIEPTVANVTNMTYPGARAMFVYVKNAHLDAIQGLREFIRTWSETWAPGGPLENIGLITNSSEVIERNNRAATEFTPLSASDLK